MTPILEEKRNSQNKISLSMSIITIGIVYGDIGTSPLYVMKSLVTENGGLINMNYNYLLGAVSLIFWTLAIITTLKYVVIALRADNKGEGGIFSLYTLVRHQKKWLVVPAMVGGAALLADGTLTPAVTVTTAIEGLKTTMINHQPIISNQEKVILITIVILSVLFFIQRFGTQSIGKMFGPVMLIWFVCMGIIGLISFSKDWSIIKAINPYYAINLLFSPVNKSGILILGSIFLATTGAEALYSDMGHVGRKNIYITWPLINISLVLSYLGQAVWIFHNIHNKKYTNLYNLNPFFDMMPTSIRLFMVLLATLAAIIASQALISGSYTLVSEAIKLKFLPRLRIIYPTKFKGQLYIPFVNLLMWIISTAIVFFFRTSAHMEAAYGLAITITMLMTTILLYQYLKIKNVPTFVAGIVFIFFGTIETIFFYASAAKFLHGGYVTVLISMTILLIMFVWLYGGKVKIKKSYINSMVSLLAYKRKLNELHNDKKVELFAENIVYLTQINKNDRIKRELISSIFDKKPKRASVYWFVTVNVTDEPYTQEYYADNYGTNYMVNIQLFLGFRIEQNIPLYLKKIIRNLMETGEITRQTREYSTIPDRDIGDWSYVLITEELSSSTKIDTFSKYILELRLFFQRIAVDPARWFNLEYSDVVYELYPLLLGDVKYRSIKRINEIPLEYKTQNNSSYENEDNE